MRQFFLQQPRAQHAAQHGPALVAVGLAILIAAAWWPAAPVATAMALVALGATGATVVRLAGTPWTSALLVLNAIVYAMLYALFFGAACHAMAMRAGADLWRVADLAVSVWPMAVAVRLSLTAIGPGHDAACDP